MDNEKFVNPDVKEVSAPVREPAKGFALASFFCGLGSLVLCWFPGGIAGIIFGRIAKKRGNRSKLIPVGFICSILSFILTVVLIVSCVTLVKESLHYIYYAVYESYGTEGLVIWGASSNLPEHLDIPSHKYGSRVTTIRGSAFSNENEIISATVPEGITTIETYAFLDCPNLTDVELPLSLKYIGEKTFATGSKLTIRYHGTMAQWELIEKHENWYGSEASQALKIVCKDGVITLIEG